MSDILDVCLNVFFFVVNKVKVYYGLLKEPDINIPIDDEDEGDDADKPKVWHIIEKALC